MPTNEYEGGTGGKTPKRSLRRVQSTPYDRPPSAARRIHGPPSETDAEGRRWFSKLVDPASRVIVRSASSILSVFGKGLAAPSGKNISTIEEVPEVKSSPEVREQGGNPIDVRLSIHNDGSDRSEQELISRTDAIFELEQLLKQKRFPRDEIDRLTELLHSRTIEPSTLPSADYKNKGKINEDTSINSSSSSISSQQAVSHVEKEKVNPSQLEGQREPLVNLHGSITPGVHVNIREEGFDSPIEIARAYMGKSAPSTLRLQSQILRRDKASPLNLRFVNKLSNAASASKSSLYFPVIPGDSGNDCMTQKSRGRSPLYRFPRSPYYRSFMTTNPREYSPYKNSNVEPTRSLEWTPSLSNIRRSGHGQPPTARSVAANPSIPGLTTAPQATAALTPAPATAAPTPTPATAAPTPAPATATPTPAPATAAPTPASLLEVKKASLCKTGMRNIHFSVHWNIEEEEEICCWKLLDVRRRTRVQ